MNKTKTFFEELQANEKIDKRDKRGRRHELALILIELTLALLSNRDGNQSSILRHMSKHHTKVVKVLGLQDSVLDYTVSRSHFPTLLSKVNVEEYSKLVLDYYGIELSKEEKQWFAGDGKELKGSILKGDKRGEAVVQLVAHEDRQVLRETFFNGAKKSEVKALRVLLKSPKIAAQKLSMDALHFKPNTLQPIVKAGGTFLVGLKKIKKSYTLKW